MSTQMYDISPTDFAHHVRHATSWKDLAVRCGLEKDVFGQIRNHNKLSMLQEKVRNMRLNIDNFHGQQQPKISDDEFKTIVRESNYMHQIMKKCIKGKVYYAKEKILQWIENLDIDISHIKTRKTNRVYHKIIDTIDDETFKMLVKNNSNWTNLLRACGCIGRTGEQKKRAIMRIEELGLDTKHFDSDVIPTDKIFVVDSTYADTREIKKRLIRDFDRAYECASCKNHAFTKSDGVLLWNNKEIVLQLEHINGVNDDNRPQNLCFLCPSCHSQTSTFTARNSKKYRAGQAWLEEGKTCHDPGSIASLLN